MSTVVRAFAFRPESTTGGSGNYTVPAGKFALLTASCTASAFGSQAGSNGGGAGGGTGTSAQMWLAEGDSITTAQANTNASTIVNSTTIQATGEGEVLVNAVAVCSARASALFGTAASGTVAGNVGIFPRAFYGISQYDKKTQHIPE